VLSSMLSAAAEEGLIPHNPLLLLTQQGRRGRARAVGRARARSEPLAVDLTAWFLVLDYLRRPTRPRSNGAEPRPRRYPLDRERDALIVALGFMAGLRLPSEALGLTRRDVRGGRVHIEGRSSSGEYIAGSKTGRGRDLPLRPELSEELERAREAYRDSGQPLTANDFWISARRDGGIWTEHQADNWRRREFRPVVAQVADDYPQFSDIARATPYAARHMFISCCLQAGLSLATIAAWCGTSIQMISATYGRMIRRYEGASPVSLDAQFRTGKVEAMSLLSAASRSSVAVAQGGPTGPVSVPPGHQGGPTGGPTGQKLPPAKRQKVAV
jgi:integrase